MTNWLFWGCFKLNIHWDCRESFENCLKSWHFLIVGWDLIVFWCKVQLNLFAEWRQLLICEIFNMFLKATCPLKILIMMYDQNPIFCDTNIHLKHVNILFRFLKGLYRILSSKSWSTTMGYFQNTIACECLLKCLELVFAIFVEQGGKEEK